MALDVADDAARGQSREVTTLIYAVFVAGLCSIVYELLIATTVSYFLGDSVRYFSLTIGLYMAAMGLGAYLSKYVRRDLIAVLVLAETVLGLAGGFAIPLLYWAYASTGGFLVAYVVLTLSIGFLIGLEVPLLTRILERYDSLRVSIAHVLSLDYLGALIATLAFPLLLLPFFGVFRSGLGLGLANMTIGLVLLWVFSREIGLRLTRLMLIVSSIIVLAILAGLFGANHALRAWNNSVYDGRILHTEQTRHQQIVLNQYLDDLRLYLNGHLQFSSRDEHRYHEALVHVPMALMGRTPDRPLNLLFLGGGDGLAVREALKYPQVGRITLVELDPAVSRLARENHALRHLNGDALNRDPRVRVVHRDAYGYIRADGGLYDLIVADLPDPGTTDVARLYTRDFYRLVRARLNPDGLFVTQATSPIFAPGAFWSIRETLASVFENARPYHLLVPSFGDWGFVLAGDRPVDPASVTAPLAVDTRFLTAEGLPALFSLPKDLAPADAPEISTLDHPAVMRDYLAGWRHWGR